MSVIFSVSDETDMNNTITAIDLYGAAGTIYTIALAGDMSLSGDLPAFNLPAGVTVTLDSGGNTNDRGSAISVTMRATFGSQVPR